MKKFSLIFLSVFLSCSILLNSYKKVQAQSLYSIEEVELHQNPDDCWMVIEDNVYDLSNYLPDHDRYLNIRDWCGIDATQDYNTKAGMDRDHSIKADEMLAAYLIGELVDGEETTLDQSGENDGQVATPNPEPASNPEFAPRYKVYLPVLLTIALYLLTKKFWRKALHDFLWNSVLILGLIPVVGFGFVLALADQVSFLAKINFTQFLWLHAQLSIIISTAMILHFIKRAKIFLSQGKSSFRKR